MGAVYSAKNITSAFGANKTYCNKLLICPSAGIDGTSAQYNNIRLLSSYSYNYHLNGWRKKTSGYPQDYLAKTTESSNYTSKIMVLADDWNIGASRGDTHRGDGALALRGFTAGTFAAIGSRGAHNRRANQLFFDGHVAALEYFWVADNDSYSKSSATTSVWHGQISQYTGITN